MKKLREQMQVKQHLYKQPSYIFGMLKPYLDCPMLSCEVCTLIFDRTAPSVIRLQNLWERVCPGLMEHVSG